MRQMDTPRGSVAFTVAEARLLPLARILHYAKREALAVGQAETARLIDEALSSLRLAADPVPAHLVPTPLTRQ